SFGYAFSGRRHRNCIHAYPIRYNSLREDGRVAGEGSVFSDGRTRVEHAVGWGRHGFAVAALSCDPRKLRPRRMLTAAAGRRSILSDLPLNRRRLRSSPCSVAPPFVPGRGAHGSTIEYAMQLRTIVLACATVLLSSGVSARQAVPDPRGANLTRAELEEMLQSFQETASSSAFSGDARQEARNHAEMIRRRLSEGDLQVGDRIELVVEGHPDLTQTFTVGAGRVLPLPAIGEVQLSGVLRSELQDHLTEYIGRYIVNP